MRRRKKDGFTLIEMLITVAIVSVVALLMFTFFNQGFTLYSIETESAEEQMNMRQVLSEITNKARLTNPGSISHENGMLIIDDYVYTFDNGNILRNGTVIATSLSAFYVNIEFDMLEIGITNSSGTLITTSLSLS